MMALPVQAAFDYVPPAAPATFALALDILPLGTALDRLAPDGLELRFDRRVDTARSTDPGHASLESLLHAEGLAVFSDGSRLVVYPEGVDAGAIEIAEALQAAGPWHVREGEMLRAVLERWGAKAGVDIVWLTDRRWRLDESRAFDGRFAEAVRALLFALSHLPHAPAGELAEDGRSLVVLHRLPGVQP